MAVSAAIALAGLGMAVYGAVKKEKAAKEAKANKQPEYKIPQEEVDNLRLAETLGNQGMSLASRNAYQNAADRGLTATTGAILRGGGDANSIGNAYQKYNEGVANMSIYDDQRRLQNLQNLMGQRSRMSSFRDKDYQLNEYSPWANRAQALAAQMAGAQNTQMSGINTAIGGLSGVAQGMSARSQQQSHGNQWSKPQGESMEPLRTDNFYSGTVPQYPTNNGGNQYTPVARESPQGYEPFYGDGVETWRNPKYW